MFNELSRADLEALFRKIYNQSADTPHLLTLERLDSKRHKLGDGPTEKQRATRSLGAFGVLPNECEFADSSALSRCFVAVF